VDVQRGFAHYYTTSEKHTDFLNVFSLPFHVGNLYGVATYKVQFFDGPLFSVSFIYDGPSAKFFHCFPAVCMLNLGRIGGWPDDAVRQYFAPCRFHVSY